MQSNHSFPLDFMVRRYRHRVVLSFCYVNLLWLNIAYGQRYGSSFGPLIERSLPYVPRALAVGSSYSGRPPEIAVAANDQSSLYFYSIDSTGSFVDRGVMETGKRQHILRALDIDRDGNQEFLGLSADGSEFSIFKRGTNAPSITSLPVETRPQNFAVADVNNDGRNDILLFGKSMAGVVVYYGRNNGTYTPGPTLFPEISVSDLQATDLNGDGITDILLLNWLSNQLVVMYGISHAVFSEAVAVDLPGEPASLAITGVSPQRTVEVAVTLPAEHRILVLLGDAAGDFGVTENLLLPGTPSGIALREVSGDSLSDILSLTPRGLYVSLAARGSEFAGGTLFGAASTGSAWTVDDVDGDGKPDLVIADRTQKKLVAIANARHDSKIQWPNVYAVGGSPHGIALSDVNGDGKPDVIVANTGSATLSVLLNEGDGRLDGQVSLSVADRVEGITPVTGTTDLFVTSHTDADRVSVVSLRGWPRHATSMSMPTGPNPIALFAKGDEATDHLEILLRSGRVRDASLSLSLFERMSGKRFLERSLRASVPLKIKTLAVEAKKGSAGYDMLFSTHDKSSRRSTVWRAEGTTSFDFKTVRSLFSYSDTLSQTEGLFASVTGNDGIQSVGVVLGPPENRLGIATPRADGSFSDSLFWLWNVQPQEETGIQLQDVDGDGNVDMSFIDGLSQDVVICYGRGNGTFSKPLPVVSGEGVTGLAIGPLLDRSAATLVLANGSHGTVSILPAPWRK